jgi:hypothetical protein
MLLSFVDLQGWSSVSWVFSQKGGKIGAWRLVFEFILLGLCTTKRSTPRMVWVNSSYAPTSHPICVIVESTPRICVAAISRAETPAPGAWRLQSRNVVHAPTLCQPANSISVVEPELGQRLWPEILAWPTWTGDCTRPGPETPVWDFLVSRSPASVQARC